MLDVSSGAGGGGSKGDGALSSPHQPSSATRPFPDDGLGHGGIYGEGSKPHFVFCACNFPLCTFISSFGHRQRYSAYSAIAGNLYEQPFNEFELVSL